MILVLLGAPGSGKGTQAQRLMKERSLPQLSTGDMLRSAIQKGTDLGLKAKGFMDRGELVPDQVVVGLIAERSQDSDCVNGYILDGFPRTIPQAEALDKMLSERNAAVGRAVLFQVQDEEVVQRIAGRRSCANCGAMYHVDVKPPKKAGVCDQCGSNQIVLRDDDRADVVRKRLEVYRSQTAPLQAYYEKAGILRTIDASQSPDQVFQSLIRALQ